MFVTAAPERIAMMDLDTDECIAVVQYLFPSRETSGAFGPRLFFGVSFMADHIAKRLCLLAAGLIGAYGVAFGAYAAHGLVGHPQELAEKASHFALIHALALLALSQGSFAGGRWLKVASGFFALGCLLFCGALTLLAVTDLPVGPVAPFGGTSFILGWASLAVAALRRGL